MNNDLIEEKRFWRQNWFLGTKIIAVKFIGLLFSEVGNFKNLAHAYTDRAVFENAISKANGDIEEIQTFRKLASIDQLAIFEGNAIYSNNNNGVAVTVRVPGEKENGKMDILTEKFGGEWCYKSIKIRNKKTNKEVQIIPQ